jgi:site-specific recombinase XerD
MCGYSIKLGIHNARHTTATRLIKKNTPLPVVQRFLGHANIGTTMKYVHVEDASLAEASKNLYPQRGEMADIGSSDVVAFPARSVA